MKRHLGILIAILSGMYIATFLPNLKFYVAIPLIIWILYICNIMEDLKWQYEKLINLIIVIIIEILKKENGDE